MYDHHLNDMVSLLIQKKIIPADKQKQATAILQKYWEDKIAVVWGIEDVIEYAKGQKKRVSKAHAKDILKSMLRRHDCEYGISWDTIWANL